MGRMGIRMLAEASGTRDNNFDLIRLIAALMVLVAHSFPLSGTRNVVAARFFFGYSIDVVAVAAFFTISGFLVSKSIEQRGVVEYFRARALRLMPGLFAVSVLTAFVLGPLLTSAPLREYFHSSATYSYLWNTVPYKTQFGLPGLFQGLPVSGGVNGSLWTIPIEASCYVALALLFVVGKRSLLFVPACAIAVALALALIPYESLRTIPFFGTTGLFSALNYGLFFLVGSCYWIFRRRVSLHWVGAWAAVIVLFLGLWTEYTQTALYLALPYLVFWFAYGRRLFANTMRSVGDLSYGTYLYAFPIQQSIAQLSGLHITGFGMVAAAIACTLPIAWLSWRFVEKPFLRLKRTRQPEMANVPA